MQKGQPFRRLAVFQALVAAASNLPTIAERSVAMAAIPAYQSRGKGRNKSAIGSKKGAHMAFVRKARKLRAKRK